MPNYAVKFGIGGVQDFISQARKVLDLAAASSLVSKISYGMAVDCLDLQANALIPIELREDAWPHQFSIIWSQTDDTALCESADAIAQSGRERLLTYAFAGESDGDFRFKTHVESFLSTRGLASNCDFAPLDAQEMIDGQIATALDVYWVGLRLDNEVPSNEELQELNDLFDARKYTRTFSKQPSHAGNWRAWTCSLCGMRTSVLRPNGNGWPGGTLFNPRERLCAVCTCKRIYGRTSFNSIPSTHRMARVRLKVLIQEQGLIGGSDGQWPERKWNELLDNWNDLEGPDWEPLLTVMKSRATLVKEIGSLLPYYAVVLFDGDEMGSWLSGVWFPDDRRAAARKALSQALLDFACEVRTLPDTSVWPVYTGGDDGLVFTSIEGLLPFLKHAEYCWGEVKNVVSTFSPVDDRRPTLTAHASIVHEKAPLQAVLQEARRGLERAKSAPGGRNCIAVLAEPRGGAPMRMMDTWDERLIETLDQLHVTFLGSIDGETDNDKVSRSMTRNMVEQLGPFFKEDGRVLPDLQADYVREVERLISRAGSEEPDTAAWEPLREWIQPDPLSQLNPPGMRVKSGLPVLLFLSRCLRRAN